jgi:hypothetical protein
MQLAPVFLAMTWRYADGSFTVNFWYVSSVALLMVAGGIWGLLAPESFRVFYFNIQRKLHSLPGNRNRSEAPSLGWGWGSTIAIRMMSAVAVALAAGFMTWVVFFTVPGVAY